MATMPMSIDAQQKFDTLFQQGAPKALAQFLANMDAYSTAFDIVYLAGESQLPEDAVAAIYGKILSRQNQV